MDKLIDSASFSKDWKVTLLDVESPSTGLEKAAAADEVSDFVKKINIDSTKFYLHINAMGAGEYYGSNRNADYFPEDNLIRWHKTFETSPAHVYRHHVNKNPEIAIGKVIFSYYNPRMHRVELIAELDKQKASMELAAINAGDFPMTSMACNTPFDKCSICGNEAHSRAEYCSHLTTQLNQQMPDGRRVMAMNIGPLRFFDISIVIRPADITSSVLEKVAGDTSIVIGSAETADAEGVSYGSEKKASIRKEAINKVADIIKNIPGEVVDSNESLSEILDSIKDPDDEILETLKIYPLGDTIKTLAFLGISPSIEFLVKIIACKYIGEREDEIAEKAMEYLAANGVDSIPLDSANLIPEIEDSTPNDFLIKLLSRYSYDSSYRPEYVEKRAFHTGYANTQPGRIPIEASPIFTRKEPPGPTSSTNAIMSLVGGALVAKMMINAMVGLRKSAGVVKSYYGVEKSAELTKKLMELAFHKDLENYRND